MLELRGYDDCLEESHLSLSHFVGLIQNASDKTKIKVKPSFSFHLRSVLAGETTQAILALKNLKSLKRLGFFVVVLFCFFIKPVMKRVNSVGLDMTVLGS